MISISELLQFGIFVTGLIKLCFDVFQQKK